MKKKAAVILAIILILAAAALAVLFLKVRSDPNYIVKKKAVEIRENEPREISFRYRGKDGVKRLPALFFVPGESGEYSFAVTDIQSDSSANLSLYVADEVFADYLVLNDTQAEAAEDGPAGMEGQSFLQKGQKYYIMTVVTGDSETGEFDGSLKVSVSKMPDVEEPAELKANDSVTLKMKDEEQSCALFRPEESSYYIFDTQIVSADASLGFSSVSSVSSDDDHRITLTNGIAWLEGGKDYYVWAEVHETGKGKSEVSLSCRRMQTAEASGFCEMVIEDAAVIEYTADSDGYIAVYSLSDGDPGAAIYEVPGFTIRSDDNSGDVFSGNGKDFAMVFRPEKGKMYRIGVYGKIKNCKVVIEPYDSGETEGSGEEAEGSGEVPEGTGAEAENTEDEVSE